LQNLDLVLPQSENIKVHNWHLYAVKIKKRDALRKHLAKQGIGTAIHYPKVLYNQLAIKPYGKGRCPAAEKTVKEILSLPLYPELTNQKVKYICRAIKKFFTK